MLLRLMTVVLARRPDLDTVRPSIDVSRRGDTDAVDGPNVFDDRYVLELTKSGFPVPRIGIAVLRDRADSDRAAIPNVTDGDLHLGRPNAGRPLTLVAVLERSYRSFAVLDVDDYWLLIDSDGDVLRYRIDDIRLSVIELYDYLWV